MEGLLSLAFFIIFFAGGAYIDYRSKEAKRNAWRTLADIYNFSYVPGTFFGLRTYVSGNYRGHLLTLTTVEKSSGKTLHTYSRVEISGVGSEPLEIEPNMQPLGQQPSAYQIVQILSPEKSLGLHAPLKFDPHDRTISYEWPGLETNTAILEDLFDTLSEIAHNYLKVVGLGSEAMVGLHNLAGSDHPLRFVARQLRQDIAKLTEAHLSHRVDRLFCPNCLVRCGKHKLSFGLWSSLSYYGCRACQQSRSFLEGRLVAVLDSNMTAELTVTDKVIRVNWLQKRTLGDFEEIWIIQASDEDVERFAMQIGNDTDTVRKSRYKQIFYTIAPSCPLSENSLRVLDRILGQTTTHISTEAN